MGDILEVDKVGQRNLAAGGATANMDNGRTVIVCADSLYTKRIGRIGAEAGEGIESIGDIVAHQRVVLIDGKQGGAAARGPADGDFVLAHAVDKKGRRRDAGGTRSVDGVGHSAATIKVARHQRGAAKVGDTIVVGRPRAGVVDHHHHGVGAAHLGRAASLVRALQGTVLVEVESDVVAAIEGQVAGRAAAKGGKAAAGGRRLVVGRANGLHGKVVKRVGVKAGESVAGSGGGDRAGRVAILPIVDAVAGAAVHRVAPTKGGSVGGDTAHSHIHRTVARQHRDGVRELRLGDEIEPSL